MSRVRSSSRTPWWLSVEVAASSRNACMAARRSSWRPACDHAPPQQVELSSCETRREVRNMIKRLFISGLVATAFMFGYTVIAQVTPPATNADRVVGEITTLDAAKKQLTLKTSAGKTFLVKTD